MTSFRVLFVDTETTGICDMRTPYNEDTLFEAGWPYITQLSYTVKVYDSSFTQPMMMDSNTVYFKPEYPEEKYALEAQKVSGISYKTLLEEGYPVKSCLYEFIEQLERCDFVVAHNAVFDMKMIKAECLRHGIDTHMCIKPWVDTMYHGTEWMRSVGLTRSRFVKLGALYQFLTGKVVDAAHKADADVDTTIVCFEELCKRHVLTADRLELRIKQHQEQLNQQS